MITEQEKIRITNITSFLSELTQRSPYQKLLDCYIEIQKYIAQVIETSRTASPTGDDLREIYTRSIICYLR
jgi:hypothetical protein